MHLTLKKAGATALTAALLFVGMNMDNTVAFAEVPLSSARSMTSKPIDAAAPVQFIANPVIQPLPKGAENKIGANPVLGTRANSLAELVAEQDTPEYLSSEMKCLAGAIYFESKGEPLAGQLAVGRVIVNRSNSGRFPSSYCGVVYQPSQFSFVRGRSLPYINENSKAWREALAIAQIADTDSWESPVEGALFFHATHVSPRWRLKRLDRVGNHVFYR